MQYYYEPGENERVAAARDSFSGRLLTNSQFEEALAVTNILEREIKTSGAFKEKLGEYAIAYARTQKLDDVMKADTVLRDLFRERTGMSMNQYREQFMEREKALTPQQIGLARDYAYGIGELIENGVKMTFNRAYAHQGEQYANELGITDAGAKAIMREQFKAAEGQELYDWGKNLEEQFYRPQIEAEKQQREQEKAMARSVPTQQRGPQYQR